MNKAAARPKGTSHHQHLNRGLGVDAHAFQSASREMDSPANVLSERAAVCCHFLFLVWFFFFFRRGGLGDEEEKE